MEWALGSGLLVVVDDLEVGVHDIAVLAGGLLGALGGVLLRGFVGGGGTCGTVGGARGLLGLGVEFGTNLLELLEGGLHLV